MKAIEQLERLKRMNELIKAESTGTPEELVERLGIGRRQLYAEIDFLKDLGAEIEYSRRKETFIFCNGHEIEISYTLKVIPKEVAKKINGGYSINFLPCFFYARKEDTLVPGLTQ